MEIYLCDQHFLFQKEFKIDLIVWKLGGIHKSS